MSDDKIVEWRPRDQVPRPIESFVSQRPARPWDESMPVRLDPNVQVGRLIRGLASVGMVCRHDNRTGAVVIMPIAIARIESSQEE